MRVTKQIKRLHKLEVAELQGSDRKLVAEKQVIEIYDGILNKKAPSFSSTLPASAVSGTEYEFSSSTDAGGYEDELVYVNMTVSNYQKTNWWYKEDEEWKEWKNTNGVFIFGNEATGFPLKNTSSSLKVKFTEAGEYTIKKELVRLNDKSVLATETKKVSVSPAPEPEPEPEPEGEETVQSGDVKAKTSSKSKKFQM